MPRPKRETFDPLRSITRLAVGGLLLSYDELQRQMRIWEQETDQHLAAQRRQPSRSKRSNGTAARGGGPAALPTASPTASAQRGIAAQPGETLADVARYALIGLLFETQQHLTPRTRDLQQIDQFASSLIAPLLDVLEQHQLLAPVRAQFRVLVGRGEVEAARWVERGRAEEARSRQLVKVAARMSTETTIHQVVNNNEVRELVQEQGAGIADEVVTEVREHAVSADAFIEGLVRVLLKRRPRAALPLPPRAVRDQAAPSVHPPES